MTLRRADHNDRVDGARLDDANRVGGHAATAETFGKIPGALLIGSVGDTLDVHLLLFGQPFEMTLGKTGADNKEIQDSPQKK